VLDWIFAIKAG